MNARQVVTILMAMSLNACGCNDDNPAWDGFLDTGLDPTGEYDLPLDTMHEPPPVPDATGDNICDEQDIDIHHELVRLMLILDQSSSMHGTPWNDATTALEALLVNPAFYGAIRAVSKPA